MDAATTSEAAPPTGVRMPVPSVAVLLFITSEAAFFAAMFLTYYFVRVVQRGDAAWDISLTHALPLGEVTVNTLVLLASSGTAWTSSRFRRREHFGAAGWWLAATIGLGLLFLVLQVHEYVGLVGDGHGATSSSSAGIFYGLTGLHGAHVLGGVLALSAMALRTRRQPGGTASRHAIEAATMYWHFVDAMWLVIVASVYLPGKLW